MSIGSTADVSQPDPSDDIMLMSAAMWHTQVLTRIIAVCFSFSDNLLSISEIDLSVENL
jgi:hypothetical protein